MTLHSREGRLSNLDGDYHVIDYIIDNRLDVKFIPFWTKKTAYNGKRIEKKSLRGEDCLAEH
jgi:hypothetical protein